VLLLNNLTKYLIGFLIVVPIFGQINNSSNSRSINIFRAAVEEYNNANYKEADLIINNISAYEKKYFSEEIILLSMRVKYRLNDYSASKEIGKSLLRNYPNSKYTIDVLITFGDIFITQGMYDAAFRAYIKSYKENDDNNYIENITKRILLTIQFGVSQNIPDELLSAEINPQLIQILLLAKAHSEIQVGKITKASDTLSQIKVVDFTEIDHDYYLKHPGSDS
jgi:tetratricopeptide (TPR) repeat protein